MVETEEENRATLFERGFLGTRPYGSGPDSCLTSGLIREVDIPLQCRRLSLFDCCVIKLESRLVVNAFRQTLQSLYSPGT